MALGAESDRVMALVLGEGLRVAAAGIVLGSAGAWELSRVLKGTIAGLGELDLVPLGVTVAMLTVATLAACWGPALRATRVDPSAALRME